MRFASNGVLPLAIIVPMRGSFMILPFTRSRCARDGERRITREWFEPVTAAIHSPTRVDLALAALAGIALAIESTL